MMFFQNRLKKDKKEVTKSYKRKPDIITCTEQKKLFRINPYNKKYSK
jgi:hypothetical protein